MDDLKELIPTSMAITSNFIIVNYYFYHYYHLYIAGYVSLVWSYIMEWTGEYDKLVLITTDDH